MFVDTFRFNDDVENLNIKKIEAEAKLDEYRVKPQMKQTMSDLSSADKTLKEAKNLPDATAARAAYNVQLDKTLGVKEVQSVRGFEDGQRWLTELRLRALQPTGQRPWTNLSPSKAHARRLRAS